MIIKKRNSRVDIERLICFLALYLEILIILLCFIFVSKSWLNTEFLSVSTAILYAGIILSVLITASYLVTAFFNQLAVEKKILVMLGSIAISLGVLGFSDLVFENKLTFIDSLYKSLQFFIGEFEYTSLYDKPVPLMINVGRYLGLFVTFGTIFTIILKQKIYYMNIKFFYRDVLIIADEPEGLIGDLINKFKSDNRRVIIACTQKSNENIQIKCGEIPVVTIDIKKNMRMGLKLCNAKNTKNIYLLCNETKDNITLAKAIFPLINFEKENSKNIVKVIDHVKKMDTIDVLIQEYRRLVSKKSQVESTRKVNDKTKKTACYIQYKTDEERKYYALDDDFTARTDDFDAYFVNMYDISIRQMIANSTIADTLGDRNVTDKMIDELNGIVIAVAGSGELLNHAITEIVKNCVYNTNTPMNIICLRCSEMTYEVPAKIKALVNIESISIIDFHEKNNQINQLFICSDDEKEIQNTLHQVFQYDIQERISEYIILTNGGIVEYEILKTYIRSLIGPYASGRRTLENKSIRPVIRLSNITDLIPAIDRFYQKYAPSGKEVYNAYKKAIINSELQNFNRLPERFIDSNILSALHNSFIINIVDQWVEDKSVFNDENDQSLKELLIYLAATEHERWYNERYLQGFIYSDQSSHLYNRNANFMHWYQLSDTQKNENLTYVIASLIAQYDKLNNSSSNIYENVIQKFNFYATQENNI